MKNKLFLRLCLMMIALLSLHSCRQELDSIHQEHHNHSQSQYKTRQLTGNEALVLFNAISPKLAALQKVKFLSKNGTSASYNIGTLDYSKAVEVIDSLGITNYTFRVNHADDSETIFHNLVANKVGAEYKFTLLKYEINKQSAGINKALQGSFSGKVTSFYLDDASECPPVTVDISEGTPGGGSEPGSPVDPPGSGGSGTGGSCIELSYAIECLNCHKQFNSWNSFQSAVCGNGAYPYQIIVRSTVKSLCKTSITGCLPEGGVGVIEPSNNPCEKTKAMLANPAVQIKLDSLKNHSTTTGELGFKTKKDGTASGIINGGKHSVDIGIKSGYQGGYHNHTSTGIPMHSPPDIDSNLLAFARSQPTGEHKNAYFGMVVKKVCSACPGGFKIYNYIMRFDGEYNDALTNFSQLDIDNFNTDYQKLESAITDKYGPYGSTYIDSMGKITNEGLEKLFFDTIKKMGLSNKVILQRIEDNGTVNNITLNPDGLHTTANPCL